MAQVLCVLVAAAAAAAVHVPTGAPAAGGYIYRSDNGGPPSLIRLGALQYAQPPPAFAPGLSVVESLALPPQEPEITLSATPLSFITEARPLPGHVIAQDDDEEDDEYEEEHPDPELYPDLYGFRDGHKYEQGAGSKWDGEEHHAHGEKGSKGYNSKDHHATGESGHYGKENKKGFYGVAEGEKGAHHDEADAHGKHHESGSGYKGSDGGHKKHFSKGEDVTGYHKVFHKDEFKKDHDFYDVADNSGHFNKYGNEKGHHGSEEGGHKEGGHSDSASNKGEFGQAGFRAKGHHDEKDESHSAEEGKKSHYHHDAEHAKKGGGEHEKEYHFVEKGDDDYDDDDVDDDDDLE